MVSKSIHQPPIDMLKIFTIGTALSWIDTG